MVCIVVGRTLGRVLIHSAPDGETALHHGSALGVNHTRRLFVQRDLELKMRERENGTDANNNNNVVQVG